MAINEALVYRNKGLALKKEEKFAEAIKSFNKAIQLDPDYVDAYNDRGNSYHAMKEYEKAIEDYSTVIQQNPKYTHAYHNRGNAYDALKKYDVAIENYSTAIKIDPKYIDSYHGRALSYTKIGNFHHAIKDYNEAIKINPSFQFAYLERGNIYHNLYKYDEAIENFNKAITLDPNDYKAYYNRGNIYQTKGNHDQAIADFTEVINLKPDYVDAYNCRGNTYISKGNNDRAINEFTEAIKIDDKYFYGYHNRGIAFANKIEHDKAIMDFNKAIEIDPEQAIAYYQRGLSLLKCGETEAAIDDFSMTLKKNSGHTGAKEKLDEIYKVNGEPEQFEIFSGTKGATYQRYKKKLANITLSDEVRETAETELKKLNNVYDNDSPYDSSNFAITQNYLDTIIALPWHTPELERFSLKQAHDILEDGHYGLNDVKTRILEFLSVRKMRKDTKGAILCFVGPPGVGKTSMGKSIAQAIGKPFYRFSVGGVNDESTIRGGRRFYMGAEPGRIIHGLKTTKTKAPVMMIDEIDKIAVGIGVNGGDPSAALLEVLDPEQNNSFRDHFLDIPFDLSNVFFIVTANNLSTLPEPLLDRMEIIEIPGYVDVEKLQIAKKYLIPKSLEKNGLNKDMVIYSEEALIHIVTNYEKEAGVRLLEQHLDKIHRKIVRQIIEKQEELESGETSIEKIILDKKQVEIYLGKPRFSDDDIDIQKADKPGLAVGLAVQGGTQGIPLIVETSFVPGKEGFTITGNMKKVMKESVKIAFSHAQKLAIERFNVSPSWFEKKHFHIHIPTGNPKDGNSAGITLAVALLSLFTDKIMTDKLAMTGELSLSGQVLAIGGLKEKIIGAKRNKAEHIIFPKQNLRDLDEIPKVVKDGIEFHAVERFEEVIALAFLE